MRASIVDEIYIAEAVGSDPPLNENVDDVDPIAVTAGIVTVLAVARVVAVVALEGIVTVLVLTLVTWPYPSSPTPVTIEKVDPEAGVWAVVMASDGAPIVL